MRRRVLIAILGVTAVAIMLFAIPLAIVFERLENEGAALRLERQAIVASRNVPADFDTGGDPVELPETPDGVRFGLYDQQGALVAGFGPSQADTVTLRALRNEFADLETPEVRVAAVPVAANERVVGAIRAEQSNVALEARTARILASIAGLAILVLGIGASIGYVVAGRLTQPVRRLRDAAVKLGQGDFMIDVPRSSVLELDEAAQAMTATAHRLDDLVTRERLFSTDVSHQLRTPLAGLRTAIETELAFPRGDSTEVLREAIADLDRLERTISELLAIARTPDASDSPFFIADVLDEVDAKWLKPFGQAGRALVIAPSRFIPPVHGNSAMLRHALDVLLENSLQHGAGEVRVENAQSEDLVTLTITDEGPGFESDPFLLPEADRTDTGEASRGFGLPLAKRLIESMPGRISVARAGLHPRIDVVLQRADQHRDRSVADF